MWANSFNIMRHLYKIKRIKISRTYQSQNFVSNHTLKYFRLRYHNAKITFPYMPIMSVPKVKVC